MRWPVLGPVRLVRHLRREVSTKKARRYVLSIHIPKMPSDRKMKPFLSSCWLIKKTAIDGNGSHSWTKKAPNAINTSPRCLGIWLAGHVGRSLIKPGHAHVMTWFKSPFSLQNVLRQQRLNLPKRPTTKTSQKILQISSGSSMERKKNARSLYVQQKCPTESSF